MSLPRGRLVIGLWVFAVGLLVLMHFVCISTDAFGIPDGADAMVIKGLALVAFTSGTVLASRDGKQLPLWKVLAAVVTGALTIVLIDAVVWGCKVMIGR